MSFIRDMEEQVGAKVSESLSAMGAADLQFTVEPSALEGSDHPW